MNWQDDSQYEEYIVKSATPVEGGWDLSFEENGCIFLPSDQCDETPVPGEVALLFGKGMGYSVRGILIGPTKKYARVYFYRTEEEQDAREKQWVADEQAKRQKDLDENRAQRDTMVSAMPEPFRKRIRFFQRTPDWRRDHELYEMATCATALQLIDTFKDRPEDLREWYHKPYEEQTKEVTLLPGLSGNQVGCATMLAHVYFQDPEIVWQAHGALCPLVGCDVYGCWAGTEEAAAEREVEGAARFLEDLKKNPDDVVQEPEEPEEEPPELSGK